MFCKKKRKKIPRFNPEVHEESFVVVVSIQAVGMAMAISHLNFLNLLNSKDGEYLYSSFVFDFEFDFDFDRDQIDYHRHQFYSNSNATIRCLECAGVEAIEGEKWVIIDR